MHHHVLHESCAESQAEPLALLVQLAELVQPAESAVLSALA
jgi:hypothetical protein